MVISHLQANRENREKYGPLGKDFLDFTAFEGVRWEFGPKNQSEILTAVSNSSLIAPVTSTSSTASTEIT